MVKVDLYSVFSASEVTTIWRYTNVYIIIIIIIVKKSLMRWREIGEIVCCLDDKKNKISAPCQTVATMRIAPKVCQGQLPTFGSQSSKFHPNRFTFGGVLAGRVKAVKTRPKVNPILGTAIASRQVIMLETKSRLKVQKIYNTHHWKL